MRIDAIKNTFNLTKKLENWLFYFFIAIMTLSIRKIIYMRQIRFSFNEYASVYIYLSDIVLILILFLFILNNKKEILSNIKKLCFAFKLFHMEQFRKIKNNVPRGTNFVQITYAHVVNKYWIIFPLVAVFFSFISILWTTEWKISIFRSVKLLEFVLLYFYIIHVVPRGTNEKNVGKMFHVEQNKDKKCITEDVKNKCSTWNKMFTYLNNVPRGTLFNNIAWIVVLTGFVQGIIGIAQFITQKSAGLFWLKESIISPQMSGVAKIIFNNQAYVRAYGLFPHPNILGGYLVLSIFFTLLLIKLFHVEQCSSINFKATVGNEICSTWNKCGKSIWKNVPRGTNAFKIILIIQTIALLLTFSKSAFFGLLMGLFYIHWFGNYKNVPRGTNNESNSKLFHVEQFRIKLVIFLILLFGLFNFVRLDWNSLFVKTFEERNFYINVSRGTILNHPFLGVGAGQFIFEIENIKNVNNWQFQPVHNVFLLISSEYGLLIALGFVLFILNIFKNCSTYPTCHKKNSTREKCLRVECFTWNKIMECRGRRAWNIFTFIAENITLLYLKGVLISFVFIMLFDHYLWDIQQGSLMFWLLAGLMMGLSQKLHK